MAHGACTPSGPEICDGKDNDCNGQVDELTPATANKLELVASKILLPGTRTDYAIDLNGDGKLDNQLAALVAVMKSQGSDANAQIAASITSGDQILLADEASSDTTYQSDACASADLFTGKATANPDYSGSGHFTVDTTVPAGHFSGAIDGGTFSSILPTDQTTPVTLTLDLVMFPGRTIPLPLVGAHMTLTQSGNAVSGEIHGAIRHDDVENNILPAFAAQVQEQVMNNPNDPSSQQLLGYFDSGGSPDPDGSCGNTCKTPTGCAMADDGKIDTCEVTTDAVVQGVVASDVQMFSDDGSTYMPNPKNTHKDSLSLGIHFDTVGAAY